MLSIGVWGLMLGCGPLGNGDVVSETRTVATFSSVDADNGVEVTLTVDPAQEGEVPLTVLAESNLVDRVVTEVRGGTLFVDIDRPATFTEAIEVSGVVASIDAAAANNGAALLVEGVSAATLGLDANNGASLTVLGTADALVIDADNGARLDAGALIARTADLRVDNGANATLCVSDTATGAVDNGGKLTMNCGADTSGVSTANGGSVHGR